MKIKTTELTEIEGFVLVRIRLGEEKTSTLQAALDGRFGTQTSPTVFFRVLDNALRKLKDRGLILFDHAARVWRAK